MSAALHTGSVLDPAGPVAAALSGLAWVLILGAAGVFVIVMALLVWVLRKRAGRRSVGEPRLVRHWIIAGGLVFPSIVLGALMVHLTQQASGFDVDADPQGPIVGVTAHSWWWQVRYDAAARGTSFTTANEIRLPVGRVVTVGLTSADVIHSLWVPALAGKVDMLPGRVHQLRLLADRPGVFRGQCAEFCGAQHARMALHVVAMEPAAYERWLAAQAAPASMPVSVDALRGLEIYRARRCAACHDIRGLVEGPQAQAPLGPDLTHLASRLHLAAGTLPLSSAALQRWVAHSQELKPGVRMPSYEDLGPADLQALVAFLEGLK